MVEEDLVEQGCLMVSGQQSRGRCQGRRAERPDTDTRPLFHDMPRHTQKSAPPVSGVNPKTNQAETLPALPCPTNLQLATKTYLLKVYHTQSPNNDNSKDHNSVQHSTTILSTNGNAITPSLKYQKFQHFSKVQSQYVLRLQANSQL